MQDKRLPNCPMGGGRGTREIPPTRAMLERSSYIKPTNLQSPRGLRGTRTPKTPQRKAEQARWDRPAPMHTLQGQAPWATSKPRAASGSKRKRPGPQVGPLPSRNHPGRAADTSRWKEQSSALPGEGEVPAGQQELPLICFSKAIRPKAGPAEHSRNSRGPPLHLHLHTQTCWPGCGTPSPGQPAGMHGARGLSWKKPRRQIDFQESSPTRGR